MNWQLVECSVSIATNGWLDDVAAVQPCGWFLAAMCGKPLLNAFFTPPSIFLYMELNKIYNECCLETMSKMKDGIVDLVVTSPPYDDLRHYNGFSFEFEQIAGELFRVLAKNGVLVWIVGDSTKNGNESGTSFRQALYFQSLS